MNEADKKAAEQVRSQAFSQSSQPKSTNRKSRSTTTQKANSTAQELAETAHVYDSEIEAMLLKDAALDGMSLADKQFAVWMVARENTFEARKKAYSVSLSHKNSNQSSELDIKGIISDAGFDIDKFNEDLGKHLELTKNALTLPSTQPLFLLSSAD